MLMKKLEYVIPYRDEIGFKNRSGNWEAEVLKAHQIMARRNDLLRVAIGLQALTNDECKKEWKRYKEIDPATVTLLPDTHLCAVDRETFADTCGGDSGGGLVFRAKEETVFLVGVTSFGLKIIGCGKTAGAYTDVRKVGTWITDMTGIAPVAFQEEQNASTTSGCNTITHLKSIWSGLLLLWL